MIWVFIEYDIAGIQVWYCYLHNWITALAWIIRYFLYWNFLMLFFFILIIFVFITYVLHRRENAKQGPCSSDPWSVQGRQQQPAFTFGCRWGRWIWRRGARRKMKSWTRSIPSVNIYINLWKKGKVFFDQFFEVFLIFRYSALFSLFEILSTEIENVKTTWDKKIIWYKCKNSTNFLIK